ncbi:MAG: succinate--CoA ligase [ADP-forming] subunit alpha [Candidatus Xenobia bacterium]|jgi:succinyl-CoA synthetase alpha subunit
MSILIDKSTRVLVQGITGREGGFHTQQMISYGTKIVAGVTPGKGGQEVLNGVPVFNTVAQALKKTEVDASVIFVPPPLAADAILEAAHAGVKLICCITEGVPIHDMVRVRAEVVRVGARLIGPNCPGLITPGQCKIGIMPGSIFSAGNVGLISRSGTLTYQAVDALTRAGLGQSTCVGIGGDPVNGTQFTDLLPLYEKDSDTRALVVIGEIGGSAEEEMAAWLGAHKVPAVAMIAGRTAPPGKRMGHAGAIVSGNVGTAQAKVDALRKAGVPVVDTTDEMVAEIRKVLQPAKA